MAFPCSISGCKTEWSKDLLLHRLPINESQRVKWLSKIKNCLKSPMPPASIQICSEHFRDNQYLTGNACTTLKTNSIPCLNLLPEDPLDTTNSDTTIKEAPTDVPKKLRRNPMSLLKIKNTNSRRVETPSTTISIVIDDSSEDEESNKRLKSYHVSATTKEVDLNRNANNRTKTPTSIESKMIPEINLVDDDDDDDNDCQVGEVAKIETIDLLNDSDEEGGPLKHKNLINHRPVVIKQEKSDVSDVPTSTGDTSVKSKYFAYNKLNDSRIIFMTGLTKKGFENLCRFCAQFKLMSKKIDQQLSLQDQLLLTLFKYKHNVDCVMISIMFKFKRDQLVREIVVHWTKVLFVALGKIDFFKYGFKGAKRYRAIFHIEEFITEEFTMSPATPKEKPIFFKTKAKCQVVVAVDETAAVLCVSAPYKMMSAREVFTNSGLLANLKPKEHILTTQSLQSLESLAKQHKFVINDVLIEEEDLGTKIQYLAAKTEIVKNCMKNVKKCKILAQNLEFHKLTDEIIFLCIVLKNFDNCIIEKVLNAGGKK